MKWFAQLFIVCALLVVPSSVFADSLMVLRPDGKIVVNVLSAEAVADLAIPQSDYLAVRNTVSGVVAANTKIFLTNENGALNLRVGDGANVLDVSGTDKQLVEIEERPQVKSFAISAQPDGFVLEQGDLSVATQYDISIDPTDAKLALATPTGIKYVAILPREAVETTLRSKIISSVANKGAVSLVEEGSDLVYKVAGEKVLNLFNLYDYPVPVTVLVSTSTAEVVSVDQPPWLAVLNYLFA